MTVEIAVAMLIAWAVGKANRVGKPINGLTDEALDLAVNRVRNAVVAKLGGDPAVQQLLNEARATNGAVSSATQVAAERSISVAVAGDSGFSAELDRLTAPPTPPPAPAGSGSQYNNSGTFAGVMGGISATGPVNVKSKIVHQAKRHPVLTTFVVVGAVALLGFSADRLMSDPTSGPQPGGGAEAMAGTWTASDGTGTKTFNSDGGRCDGFFYNNGEPLDIGGPMTCSISSKADTEGRYTLIVTQSPNRAKYLVEFTDAEHASVFDASGTELYDLERF
ncbi:hypothetical protein ACWF99_00685 [Nocardia sp. NPDC055002]